MVVKALFGLLDILQRCCTNASSFGSPQLTCLLPPLLFKFMNKICVPTQLFKPNWLLLISVSVLSCAFANFSMSHSCPMLHASCLATVRNETCFLALLLRLAYSLSATESSSISICNQYSAYSLHSLALVLRRMSH